MSSSSKTKSQQQQASASAESASIFPKADLAQKIHQLTKMSCGTLESDSSNMLTLTKEVQDEILNEWENPYLYLSLQESLSWEGGSSVSSSTTKLQDLKTQHEETLVTLETKVQDAKEHAGDMEVLEARLEIARFAAKSCRKETAMDLYQKVLDLPKLSTGKTIDALMECSRVASFYGNVIENASMIERASKLAEQGGDWDRRNRLKVYTALSKLLARDIKGASELLVDCIATFSCNELCSYTEFLVYTILSNILHLPRPALKAKLIDGPEILTVQRDIPEVFQLMNALYDCDYKAYLHSMVKVHKVLIADRLLEPHAGYWMRELHVLGYKQFLDSYQSVTLSSMAVSFGVSTDYLDLQLSRFIAAGRLTAKIDKFGGVVETNRPDRKNAQYRAIIQDGDALLNRIQKLARVVDV